MQTGFVARKLGFCFCSAVLCLMYVVRVQTPRGFNAWNDTAAMVQFHIRSLQQQLRQLYFAFAVAFTSGRIMVLPRLT